MALTAPALASHCQTEIDSVNAALSDATVTSGLPDYTVDEVGEHLARAQQRCAADDDEGAIAEINIANVLLGLR